MAGAGLKHTQYWRGMADGNPKSGLDVSREGIAHRVRQSSMERAAHFQMGRRRFQVGNEREEGAGNVIERATGRCYVLFGGGQTAASLDILDQLGVANAGGIEDQGGRKGLLPGSGRRRRSGRPG